VNWDALNNPILWGLAALLIATNIPWSQIWAMLPAFKLPSLSRSSKEVIDKLGDIEQAIRDLGDKS